MSHGIPMVPWDKRDGKDRGDRGGLEDIPWDSNGPRGLKRLRDLRGLRNFPRDSYGPLDIRDVLKSQWTVYGKTEHLRMLSGVLCKLHSHLY